MPSATRSRQPGRRPAWTAKTVTPVTTTPTRNEINPVIDWPWVVFQAKDLELLTSVCHQAAMFIEINILGRKVAQEIVRRGQRADRAPGQRGDGQQDQHRRIRGQGQHVRQPAHGRVDERERDPDRTFGSDHRRGAERVARGLASSPSRRRLSTL